MVRGIGKTDVGKVRSNNEDSIFVSNEPIGSLPNLFIVADGMGGHNAGEVASSNAVRYFCEYIKNHHCDESELLDVMISGTAYANGRIFKDALAQPAHSGMGTTFSACVLLAQKIVMAHIGDSRIYQIRKQEIKQLSTDHTYVNEMLRSGQISSEQADNHPQKNIITRALGVEATIAVDGIIHDLRPEDKILLCSDGLSNMTSSETLLKIIDKAGSIEKSVTRLIEEANRNGGVDNISVILVEKGR